MKEFNGIDDRMEMVQKLLSECYELANESGEGFCLELENCTSSYGDNISRTISYYPAEEEVEDEDVYTDRGGWHHSTWAC